ncbi:MAG: MBOAT family protein [Ignavibacteriaceae bacterium]|nr:MBOAT family protein [Ignavibacteriaceae bacterium]
MPYPIDWTKFRELFEYVPHDPLLFGSSMFIFFFIAVLAVYRFFNGSNSFRVYTLIFFSLFFYYKAAGIYLLLLVFIAIINFYAGAWIFNAKTQRYKRLILTATIIVNLGLLGYFKYTNFFFEILNGLKVGHFDMLDIFLPIGISFYTFKAMSYLIEIYFEMLEPINSLRNFSLFVFFFPNVLMGPIDRAVNFLPQIEEKPVFTKEKIGLAVFLLCTGLFKKYVLADYISLNFTDRVVGFPLRFTGVENLLAVYGSALQGYADFSGYTDMALAIGLLLGFELMDNFNRPFKAYSVAEYWRRWHLSLSTWLLDYLFRPLQISLRNYRKLGTAIAIFITFFVVGIWHGPSFTFILFGLLHSFFLVFSMYTQPYRDEFYDKLKIRNTKWLRVLQIIFTFHLLAFTAILFRAPSLKYAGDMIKQIFTYFHSEVFTQYVVAYPSIVFLIVIGYVSHFLPDSWEKKTVDILGKTPLVFQAIILAVMIWLVAQVRSAQMQPFLYFKF